MTLNCNDSERLALSRLGKADVPRSGRAPRHRDSAPLHPLPPSHEARWGKRAHNPTNPNYPRSHANRAKGPEFGPEGASEDPGGPASHLPASASQAARADPRRTRSPSGELTQLSTCHRDGVTVTEPIASERRRGTRAAFSMGSSARFPESTLKR